MLSEHRKDNSQALFNILAQLVLNGVNFVLIMLFTRFLSTSDYGIVSIYQAYVLFFAVIVGISVQGSIGTAFAHVPKEEHDSYLSSIMLLAVISFFAILSIIALFIKPFIRFSELDAGLIFLMVTHSFGVCCFNFANIKYVYQRKAQNSFFMSLIIAGSMILLSIVAITQKNIPISEYLGRILSIAIPYIGCALYVSITTIIAKNPFVKIRHYWKFCLPLCLPLVLHGVSQVVLSQTDKIMLQKIMADNSIVGLYSFLVTFVHILNSLYIALNNTWVPIYYGYLKEEQYCILSSRSRKYNDFFTYLVVGFILVSPEFIKIFADARYWGAMELIPIIAISVYMVFLYSFAVNYELFHRESRWIAVGTTSAALCNIILNVVLIKPFGMYGAALATLVSYILMFVFHSVCSSKIIKGHFPYTYNFYLKNIVVVILASCLFWAFIDLWMIRWMLAVIVAGVIGINLYKNKTLF